VADAGKRQNRIGSKGLSALHHASFCHIGATSDCIAFLSLRSKSGRCRLDASIRINDLRGIVWVFDFRA
jgi:hypothetical protein